MQAYRCGAIQMSIAIILGLAHVAEKHRVVVDTKEDKAIHAEMGEEGWMCFKKDSADLFVFDVRKGLTGCKYEREKLKLDLCSFLQTAS